ncbi:MAG: hypothetical protein JXB39_08855 [Deltaproteobacteria bacterium]|nr:hypothetical protein [Deltaproteobacteria bacterium]
MTRLQRSDADLATARSGRWFALVALIGACAAALPWVRHPLAFMRATCPDVFRTPWYHDRMARHWAVLNLHPDSGFDHPVTQRAVDGFSTVADVLLTAPLTWILPWPAQWTAAQSAAILANAFGLAWLARVLGCRGPGIAFAGFAGAWLQPAWIELLAGKPQGVLIGLYAAALAAFLSLVPHDDGSEPRAWRIALASIVAALALGNHPPLVVLVAPVALLAPRRPSGPAVAMAAMGTLLLAAPFLARMWFVYGGKILRIGPPRCLDWGQALAVADLARVVPQPVDSASGACLSAGLWLAAGMALIESGRRRRVAALAGVAVLYALAALGSCPRLLPDPFVKPLFEWTPAPVHWLQQLLNQTSRLSIAAWVLLAMLGSLGLEAAFRRRNRARCVLAAVAGMHPVLLVLPLVLGARQWHPVGPPATARFLASAAPGVVAELPWDQAGQFLSALHQPDRIRVNPRSKLQEAARLLPAVAWLDSLSTCTPMAPPTARDLDEIELRWIFLDPDRFPDDVPPACRQKARGRIEDLLGPPLKLEEEVWVWKV